MISTVSFHIFFFNDTATTEIYTLSLHDALPISGEYLRKGSQVYIEGSLRTRKWQDKQGNDRYSTEIVGNDLQMLDRKSTRLNSSHSQDSYAVFCLKKKNQYTTTVHRANYIDDSM